MAESNDLSGIAHRVRAARHRAGLSREQLAVAADISWSAIAQVETGRRTNLRPATLSALARALGVSIDWLVSGSQPGPQMLEHRALLYEEESQFVNAALSFLRGAAERSEATLVVTSPDKVDAIRDQLGPDGKRVEFADQEECYANPSQALAFLRKFVRASVADGAHWVRILGEPVGADHSQKKFREWSRYEALLNLVFSGEPVSVLCGYDRARVDPKIVEMAYATHAHTVEPHGLRPSPSYGDPFAFVLGE